MQFTNRSGLIITLFAATTVQIGSRAVGAPSADSPNDYQVVTVNDKSERQPKDAPDHDIVVFLPEPAKRAPLEFASDAGNGEYRFSPDCRWLYGEYTLGSGMAIAEVFLHRDGPHFVALDRKKLFSDLAWEFCFKQRHAAIVKRADAEAQIIDFVAWSPDAARLLVSLRGGTRHGDGIYAWNVYWNTGTQAFELTDYLRSLNRAAERRWSDDNFRGNSALAACAEPLEGGWPDEATARKAYAALDTRLNDVYAARLGKLLPKDQRIERSDQREWLKRRDEGARVYAGFGADAAAKEVRHLQYLAGATRQRVADFSPGESEDE